MDRCSSKSYFNKCSGSVTFHSLDVVTRAKSFIYSYTKSSALAYYGASRQPQLLTVPRHPNNLLITMSFAACFNKSLTQNVGSVCIAYSLLQQHTMTECYMIPEPAAHNNHLHNVDDYFYSISIAYLLQFIFIVTYTQIKAQILHVLFRLE